MCSKKLDSFEVFVRCVTYNHANYIKEAMNGFTMQQTCFPFVCTIIDDASTDEEQEVINNYLQEHFDIEDESIARNEETEDYLLTFVRHKTNKNCYFAVLFLKYNHYSIKKSKEPYIIEWQDNSKYIALCEGDDYWTDPMKLQKQVDFMESNKEYTLCFHRAIIIDEMGFNHKFDLDTCEDRDYSATELLDKWIAPTASILYRSDVRKYKIVGEERFISGDIKLYLCAASTGLVRGNSSVMCAYRVHSDSVSRSSVFYLSRLKKYPYQYICILENFPKIDKRIIQKHLFNYSQELMHTDKGLGQKMECLKIMLRYCPFLTFRWFFKEYIKGKLYDIKDRILSFFR